MGKYIFKPYDSKFKNIYLKEKVKLQKILPDRIKIEHIGSTAVPGLGGKGIIDIAILIPKKDWKKYVNLLEKKGFDYKPRPGDEKRKFMQKIVRYSGKERRIHIHLTTKEFWNSFISFRDYLIENKEEMDKYARIKKEGIKRAKNDGKKYRMYKVDILKSLASKALKNN